MRIIQVKVKPQSKQQALLLQEDGTWLAKLKSAPVDGKANQELIALIAKQFDCRKADVEIRLGGTSRLKLVHIHH